VVGDTASLDQDGTVRASFKLQCTRRYAGKLIRRQLAGKRPPKPFRYFDKGTMAVVGKGYAVLQSGKFVCTVSSRGLAWAFIHITFCLSSV